MKASPPRHSPRRPRRRALAGGLLLSLLSACGGGGSGGGGDPAAPPSNAAPIAEAGDAQTVASGDPVQLDGGASRDSDGTIRSFAWVQSDGPAVELADGTTPIPSFTAPEVAADTDLVFTLTVTDDEGASASDSVTITVRGRLPAGDVTVSGRLLPSASQGLDGDTNDPFNPFTDNSDPNAPQRIDNPTTLGGYVNEPGAGAEGRSQVDGDREDFFIVDLLEGQSVDLLVADARDADADLYLYTPRGELIDFSIEAGERETVVVPAAGTYVVNVSIFAGATNYTLTVGSSLAPVGHREPEIVPGQAIVRLNERGELAAARREMARRMGLRNVGGGARRARLLALEDLAGDPSAQRARLGAQRYRRAQFADAERARLWDTLMSIKVLARRPEVRSAEPNYFVHPQAAVNDEAYSFQWHYPLINLPGAWDTTTGAADVIVAVIDTGVLSGHPDLQGQLVPGYDFISDPERAGDGDGIDPDPEEVADAGDPEAVTFHGTHVTGTVAAAGNNGIGVAGVAFGARVMPLRALASSGGTLFDINEAVRYAAGLPNDSGTTPARPADIINLSLAGGRFSPSSQALYNEVRGLGIAVVAAAGNESSTLPAYPAAYDNVISVSAVDVQQQITRYSNRGPTIDVAAPGGDGSVDLNGDGYPDGVLSTGASDGAFAYTFLNGTSMAAPHVAGVLALMKSANPTLEAADFDRLLSSGALADDIGDPGRDDRYGHGLINARKAVAAALGGDGDAAPAPRLVASTSALNFGSAATTLDIILRNSGGGSLGPVTLATPDPWLSVAAVVTDEEGLGQYRVRVDRDALAPGLYEGQVIARSGVNDVAVRVLVSVAESLDSDLGQIYLLLVDPQIGEPVAQTLGRRRGSAYRFVFPPVPAGRYQIFAGTDIDNDLLICDAGEACGAYLTIDQPLTVDLDRDRDDLEFPIEYFIALPGTAGADGGRMGGLPLLKRVP